MRRLFRSALTLAVFHDSPDIVKLLLQKHVNASSRDLQGWCPEQYARLNGFKHNSPQHDTDDSRPPSDDDLDLAPKKVRHPRFTEPIQAWQEPMINTEAKDGVLKPGTSTFFEDNNSDNKNEDVVTTFSQTSTEVPDFSHPAFPAPEPLMSSAVLGVTEDKCVLQACTVKEKKSEDNIKQINLSLVHLQKMPIEPEMNKEHDRKDIPVSSKHSCVEKHEDMWVKQGKFDWKNNSEFITKKANQKISKILEKCKIIFHRKGGSLRDNSELHGDLKELPSNVTDNIFDRGENDAPGASVSVGFQAFSEHKESSLENVFPSYSKSESRKYGCQSSSKLCLNENKLDENDKPDTEHVFSKTEESFRNGRENEVRNRVPFKVKEDQEFDTKRKQKRSQNTHWKSDIGRAPQVSDPKSLFGLWLARSSEMKHMIQIKSHDMPAVSITCKKTKPIQDQLQKPSLADNCGADKSKNMDPELGNVEVEENRNKSELKGSETICGGSYHEGLTRQRKRGKSDDRRFPALQKGDSDSISHHDVMIQGLHRGDLDLAPKKVRIKIRKAIQAWQNP
ncbi:Coiled-coil domain-containing protein 144A [Camelus dromedarius]|uniref:Coiled-coil domain-containing protein 144A n=1 Tax=Camelus dromedarius TaxID=9838 RepID=A0A5N4CNB2_CAMDR|nr:Coiled-coil domain-containing protein 144A [Camelus dromedarius]